MKRTKPSKARFTLSEICEAWNWGVAGYAPSEDIAPWGLSVCAWNMRTFLLKKLPGLRAARRKRKKRG